MKKHLFTFILLFSVNVFAQTSGTVKTNNWLKKNLVKEVFNINSVKIEGCKISVKESYARDFYGFSLAGNSAPIGSFPQSDSSPYFSAGPGSTGGYYRKMRLVSFDLADLNTASISTRKASLKGRTIIILGTKEEKNLIKFKEESKIAERRTFEFVVKNKFTEKFIDSFKDAIRQCQ